MGRKELRKAARELKKRSKISGKRAFKSISPVLPSAPAKRARPSGPLLAALEKRKEQQQPKDALIEAEEVEIARLEKLMGISRSEKKKKDASSSSSMDKSKIAAKLNKEYEMFEGLGEDFGDFLVGLDDLEERVKRKDQHLPRRPLSPSQDKDDEATQAPRGLLKGHILDDSEQERSDLEEDMLEEEEEEEEEEEVEEEVDAGEGDGRELSGSSDEEGDEEDEDEDEAAKGGSNSSTYHPMPGEDIYGRPTADASSSAAGAAYVPPAKRKLAAVDEVF